MQLLQQIKRLFQGSEATSSNQQEQLLLERHQVLVENLAAALVIRNLSGEITYCSPFTEVLIGYPLDSIYQAEEDFFLSLVNPADKESFERALSLSKIGESFEMRHRFFHQSQFEIWIESRTAPLQDETGQLIASLTIMLDVTGAVKFEEQLQEKTIDLQQITAVAAEEIQNEVFTLKGMLSLVGDGISVEEMNDAIERSGNKLDQLARGLTEFGKASSGKSELRTLSVSKILSAYSEEQQQVGLPVEIVQRSDELRVIADQEELLQVLSALTDYSCSLCQEDSIPKITFSIESSASEIKIYYKDSCPPIPTHLARSLFQPSTESGSTTSAFNRGKRTPFSLSLTRKRMMRMGGGLDFKVTPEGTNCFILSLRAGPGLTRAA